MLAIKLFGQYCEDNSKPIDNWKQVTRDEYNNLRWYSFDHVIEMLIVHPGFKVDTVPVLKEASSKHMHVATDYSLLPALIVSRKQKAMQFSQSLTVIYKETMAKSQPCPSHCACKAERNFA